MFNLIGGSGRLLNKGTRKDVACHPPPWGFGAEKTGTTPAVQLATGQGGAANAHGRSDASCTLKMKEETANETRQLYNVNCISYEIW